MKILCFVLGILLWVIALIALAASATVYGETMGCITITSGAVLLGAAGIMETIEKQLRPR
jgi:hypothetical protein